MYCHLAETVDDVRASQALRYKVFARELGASLDSMEDGLDRDNLDEFCYHLLVKDADNGAVIASTRLLMGESAVHAGGFYSENGFQMASFYDLPGRSAEVGRTCVDPDYRQGPAIVELWSGLSRFVIDYKIDYFFGSASIGVSDGGMIAKVIMDKIRQTSMADDRWKVIPKIPLPQLPPNANEIVSAPLPPLLKAYFRLGAKACGEPCYDADFKCADILVLVDMANVNTRYVRYFLGRDSVHTRS
ncbi:MAG: GNAT family N-acyltransferase [Gammaproteobacteria bacterium]